jgi:hypothetical protein
MNYTGKPASLDAIRAIAAHYTSVTLVGAKYVKQGGSTLQLAQGAHS